MAGQARETVPWLNSKLAEAWSSLSVTATLTKDLMQSIKEHFILFSVEIKLRLLISCIGLRKATLKELEADVKELCSLAIQDDDDWVQAMGAFISTFADRGVMAFDELLKNQYFASTFFSLKTKMEQENKATFYPLDYAFLDPSLIDPAALEASQRNSHFTVKKPTPRMPPRQVKPTAAAASVPNAGLSARPGLPKAPAPVARSTDRPVVRPTLPTPPPAPMPLSGSGTFARAKSLQKPKKMMVIMGDNEEEEILKEQEEAKRLAAEKKEQERLEKQKLAEEKHRMQQLAAEEAKIAKKRKREEKEAVQLNAKRQKKLKDSDAEPTADGEETPVDDEHEKAVPTEEPAPMPASVPHPAPIAVPPPAAVPNIFGPNAPLLPSVSGVQLTHPQLFTQPPEPVAMSRLITPAWTTPTPLPILPQPKSQPQQDANIALAKIFEKSNKADPQMRKMIEQIVRREIDTSPFPPESMQSFVLHEENVSIDGDTREESIVFEWRPQTNWWALQHKVRRPTPTYNIGLGIFNQLPTAIPSASLDLQRVLGPATSASQDLDQYLGRNTSSNL